MSGCSNYRKRVRGVGVVPGAGTRAQTPPSLMKRVRYSSSNFWGLVQNSGKPIRIVPCDLEK